MNPLAFPVLHLAPLLDSFPPLKSVKQLCSKLSAVVAITDSTVALKDSLEAWLSWADIIAIGVEKGAFSYHPPEIHDGKLVVEPPRSIHEEGLKSWEDCLVGSFIEKKEKQSKLDTANAQMEQLASNLVEKDIPVIHSTATLVRSVPDAAFPNKEVHTSNSFSALGDASMNPVIDISVNHVIETRMARAASQGVAAVTKAEATKEEVKFLNAIYADPYSDAGRQTLWDELILFSKALPAVPWLVGGDFNDIRSPSKRSDAASIQKESLSFHDKLNAVELHDIPSSGSYFTWCNNREDGPITKKLDCLMVNDVWFDLFPCTNVELLPPSCSDHCAGLEKQKLHLIQADLLANPFAEMVQVEHDQLPVDMANSLFHPITEEEIKVLVFSSLGNRSLGLDGFTVEFYKAAWSIVGDLVVKAIKEFFSPGQLLKEVNSTIISLVPKIQNPTKMTDFRPIACSCVTTPKFSVVFNGNLCGYFSGEKGVRQGDPLSLYIFVVCMEVLSRMLNKAAEEGKFAYHPKCKTVQLTLLCFADDLMIFTDGSLAFLNAIDVVLTHFY
ncbi:hypothetical protein SLEP1_g57182 [Rubroshorea leprosula]|uniref:Reverse transcriptase domain-containing protein n=1 Tax=Rubroshorea leprosula TaxID=152421 RepID=A0AAV5MKY5_9ROSI|nr:hypothetical protein SLEP1_g57182 [Rubroshorea leprosula]